MSCAGGKFVIFATNWLQELAGIGLRLLVENERSNSTDKSNTATNTLRQATKALTNGALSGLSGLVASPPRQWALPFFRDERIGSDGLDSGGNRGSGVRGWSPRPCRC